MVGDRYVPNGHRGGSRYDRNQNYHNPRVYRDNRERDNRERDNRDRRSSRSPAPDRRRDDRYRDSRDDNDYKIRGNADRVRIALPQQGKFTFRPPGPPIQGPAKLRFPSPEPEPRPGERGGRRERNRSERGRGREGRQPPRRTRGGANTRDILHRHGGSTPEQLSGMSAEGQTRFMSIDSSDEEESDEEHVDPTQMSEDEDNGQGPRKRVRIESPAGPKWSNAELYTAIPPEDTLSAPKRDIVRSIRKAKVETGSGIGLAKALQNNEDYISFNDDVSEEGELSDDNSIETPSPQRRLRRAFSPASPYLQIGEQEPNGTTSRDPRTTGLPPDDEVGTPPASLVMPPDKEPVNQDGEGRQGKKRKRAQQLVGQAEILPEWEAGDSNPTPWCTVDHSRTENCGLRLHKEVIDFYEFVRYQPYEASVREDLIDRLEQAIRNHERHDTIRVKCFGSFASGLYLPTGDMDLVAISPQYLRGGRPKIFTRPHLMHKLGGFLLDSGMAAFGSVSVVAHAKVPIVKFIDNKTGIKVDVSFENDTGLIANETFDEWKEKYPAMPPLVMLIKQLLAMRGLNEVFTGGLGGFSIICLVVSMMHLMPELQSENMDPQQHYGDLLLHFLDLYGNNFNIVTTGIDMSDPIRYFDKINDPAKKQNAENLTIIDPNNDRNDISGGSRKIRQVFDFFRSAHAAIQQRLADISNGRDLKSSVLGPILGGNYSSFLHQRNKLGKIYRGEEVSPPPTPAAKRRKQAQSSGVLQARPGESQSGPSTRKNKQSVRQSKLENEELTRDTMIQEWKDYFQSE